MEKFNNGKPFTSSISNKLYNGPHGADSGNKFARCPFGRSHNLPFCDGCVQQAKPKITAK